jgi:hypothetical protein
MIPAPTPGLYPDIHEDEYSAWDAVRSSTLKRMDDSPAHAWHELQNPSEPTESMIFGTAAHFCVLQPDRFGSRYVVAGECCATKKGDGKKCTHSGIVENNGEWFCGVHKPKDAVSSGRKVLSADDYNRCLAIRASVMSHPKAGELLGRAVSVELSGVYEDDETGVLCKFRTDAVLETPNAIVDLKTTEDANPVKFRRSIYDFGYHISGAHYLTGMAKLRRPKEHFILIAVEKHPPFSLAVYRLRDDAIEFGAQRRRELLQTYKRCREMDCFWPYQFDYKTGEFQIEDIGVPEYLMRSA